MKFFDLDTGTSSTVNKKLKIHLVKSDEPLNIDFIIQVIYSSTRSFQLLFPFSLHTEYFFTGDLF